MNQIKHIIIGLLLILSSAAPSKDKKTIIDLNKTPYYELEFIGYLGHKYGTELTVKGIVHNGYPRRKTHGGPTLMVQMINDKPIQKHIQIWLATNYGEFGADSLAKLEFDSTYKFKLYESGGFTGYPEDKDVNWAMQRYPTLHFQDKLIVTSAQKIKPIEWTPDLFVNENGLISGIAKNINDTAFIVSDNWKLELKGTKKWAESEIGKEVEVYGKFQKTEKSDTYFIKNSKPRLLKLEDQVGKKVKLRGMVYEMNNEWRLAYRDKQIYLGKSEDLPKKCKKHGQAIVISGTLEIDSIPDLDYKKPINSTRKEYYIVRNPRFKRIDGLLTPELLLE